MEFLKSCSTNVQAIPDFDAVAYNAFSVRPSRTDRAPLDDLRQVEARLRDEQKLVVQDPAKPWLWCFCATAADAVAQSPQDLPVVNGYELRREQSGVVRAAELARPPIPLRGASLSTPTAGIANTPVTPASSKGVHLSGLRAFDQNQPHDIFAIHELLISSVIALLSYHLVKNHNALALNYRSFVFRSPRAQDPGDECKISPPPNRLTEINASWASSGTLLVSFYSVAKPEIQSLEEVDLEGQHQLIGTCIRLAPNGSLAQIVSFDTAQNAPADAAHVRAPRKRVKANSVEQGVEKWKKLVAQWLSWKGYSLDLEKHLSWVKIRPAQTTNAAAASPSPSFAARDILWPKALCFIYTPLPSVKNVLDIVSVAHGRDPLSWFENAHSPGYRDPLDVAQQWFSGKADREGVFENRKRAQKAEEEAGRTKEEPPGGLFPSSPLHSRTGAYGELQAVSGVYPTPPDGVPPGTVVSNADTPGISGAAPNTVLVPGGANPAINLQGPHEKPPSDEHQSAPDPEFPNLGTSTGNDDLFEDMDEDSYEGHGVTDADFNFFDEPDGDDVVMADASGGHRLPTAKGEKQENPLVDELEMKDDMSDPMAALEDALGFTPSIPPELPPVKAEKDAGTDPAQELPRENSVQQDSKQDTTSSLGAVRREPTPPLSPQHIQEHLLPSPETNLRSHIKHKPHSALDGDSVFDPINFSRKISLSDAKYSDGRFNFTPEYQGKIPKEKKRPTSLRDMPLLTPLRHAVGRASNMNVPEVSALARQDSDFSDTSSDASFMSEEEAEHTKLPPEPQSASIVGPLKRKLYTDETATPLSAMSFAESSVAEALELPMASVDENSITSFEPCPWDWSLARLPPPRELSSSSRYSIPVLSFSAESMPESPLSQGDRSLPPTDDKLLNPKDGIVVAQIVTEQIVSSTLNLFQDESARIAASQRRGSDMALKAAINEVFPSAADCSVSTLLDVTDVFPEAFSQMKAQQRQASRRANEGPSVPSSQAYQMTAPYIRVKRGDNHWDVLPPALPFWDSLGFGPCSPSKNVGAICIYPQSTSIRPCVEHFMANVQIAYDGCKLGSHELVETLAEFPNGFIPWKVDTSASPLLAFRALRDACAKVGKLLSTRHAQSKGSKATAEEQATDAFVVYMIDPFQTAASVWESCSAFWSLFQSYGQGPPIRPDQTPKPDVVLQIIPMSYVASFDTPVIQDASVFINLAREVYDRCPPSAPSEDKTPLGIYAAPSFQIVEAIPKTIAFKLHAEPPQDLTRESSYLHIGYAISLDGTWLTAAWTDNCGKSRAVVSYNLGTRAFNEIAKEMWATTVEIIQARKVHWRVCIAKAGVVEKDEFDAWIQLVHLPYPFNLFVTLMSVDTDPPLKFIPSMNPPNPANPGTAQTTSTPGSTPQPGISPEPHGLTPAATPSADTTADPLSDPEARLIDVTDESWGIIFSHRAHNSNSTIEFRPCLISGLLVKRGHTPSSSTSQPPDPEPEHGPILVRVNIIWVGAVSPTRNTNTSNASTPSTPTPTMPSPFAPATDGASPGLSQAAASAASTPTTTTSSTQDTGRQTLMWTPTPQHRATAETLLKEVMSQYRALGTLAKLRGVRGCRMGTVPWHVAVAKRGVEGLGRCAGAAFGG